MTALSMSDDDDEFPRAFGPYLLLENFARGGMGEVYLAKFGGIAGLERYCVLKKLRQELTRDREYVTRFIDEARVVVTLNHANICHVFDVGRVVEEYYLAMEYVSGRDIRTMQDRARHRAKPIPVATTLLLVCEVLEALDYAHRRTHPMTGEPLNLVHRDVSPQNVLVSFEGEVKLIDFGLAASKLKVERTQPNIVMGKMAYMAPEQARGDAIDLRADLFAVGVLCYELLAGERFYEGMTANDIWQVAGRGGFVPPKWGQLDLEVARILAKALHPDQKKRFATCGEFREALAAHLHWRFPGTGQQSLRGVMNDLFSTEIGREREMIAGYGRVTLASFQTNFEESKSQSVTLVRAGEIAAAAAQAAALLAQNSGDTATLQAARVVKDERSTDEGSAPQSASQGARPASVSLPTPVPGDTVATSRSGPSGAMPPPTSSPVPRADTRLDMQPPSMTREAEQRLRSTEEGEGTGSVTVLRVDALSGSSAPAREETQRIARAERPEKAGAAKATKSDKVEKAAKPTQPEKPERPEKPEKQKAERPEQLDRVRSVDFDAEIAAMRPRYGRAALLGVLALGAMVVAFLTVRALVPAEGAVDDVAVAPAPSRPAPAPAPVDAVAAPVAPPPPAPVEPVEAPAPVEAAPAAPVEAAAVAVEPPPSEPPPSEPELVALPTKASPASTDGSDDPVRARDKRKRRGLDGHKSEPRKLDVAKAEPQKPELQKPEPQKPEPQKPVEAPRVDATEKVEKPAPAKGEYSAQSYRKAVNWLPKASTPCAQSLLSQTGGLSAEQQPMPWRHALVACWAQSH